MDNSNNAKITDLFVRVSRLNIIDKTFKKGQKYNRACQGIIGFINSELFQNVNAAFETKDGKVFFDKNVVCSISDELFKSESISEFTKSLDRLRNILFRTFVNSTIGCCEVSSMDIVDINQNIDSIIDDRTVKNTSRVNKIRKIVESDKTVPLLVYGNSSSGKTTAVAQAVKSLSCSYTWIDLNDVNVEIEHFIYSVFRHIHNSKHVIVIDNVQSHPSKIEWIKNAINKIKAMTNETTFIVVNICWRSAKETVAKMYYPQVIRKMECYGDDIIIEFIRENSLEKFEKDILTNSAGDVLVASRIIGYILEYGFCPSETVLSKTIFKDFTRNLNLSIDALDVLYVLAALGEFEIHVREEYLKRISEQGYCELKDNKLFRVYKTEGNDNYISLGHRSLAHKVEVYLSHITTLNESPIELAINYLTIEGENQILSTLERLDLELEIGDSIFANLWQAFGNMRDALLKQLSVDITWGNNMASMIFAVEALNNMRFLNEANGMLQRTSEEIRKRWGSLNNCEGLVFIGESYGIDTTTETIDFQENIRHTMSIDEQLYSYPANMLSDNLNYSKFHDNWLLGLLLGFEAEVSAEHSKVDDYIKCAEKMQESNGAFYPSRVCWVTARVIMGLAKCGLSYSDRIVKRACNWMVEQLIDSSMIDWPIDSLKCCGWRSGTGTWNSNEQITLMCICALFEAKYPVRQNPKTYKIVTEFWRCRKELESLFSEKGSVLDIMWIIDVMLFDNRNPIEMKEEIKNLTTYLLEQWNNASLLSTEKETESSDVSFMAKELIYIVWELLNKNIDKLLKGLELKYTSSGNSKDIFISYRREEGGGSAFAQELYKALDRQFRNNVFLDVYDLHGECGEFDSVISQALSQAKIIIAVVTDHSFERACYADYNNNDDVYFNELNEALNQRKNIITIYNSSTKSPECPDALKANADFYNIALKLSRKNATFYDATIQDAMSKLIEDVVAKINHLH